MAHGVAEIDQPALGKKDDALAVGKLDLVDLRLDVGPLEIAQRGDLDFVVEVADVADDRRVCFIARMWSSVMTSTLPVAVTKMSARGAASSMVVTS